MRTLLTTAALLLAAPAALSQDIEALERQLDKAREAAPMVVRNFMLVTRQAKYFGDYEKKPDNTFARGAQMYFYAEPRNFVAKSAGGVNEVAVDVDVEVVPEKGAPIKQPKFMSVKIPSRSRIQDLFLNLNVSLGQAPAGKYAIKFVVRDPNSSKSAAVTHDIVLK